MNVCITGTSRGIGKMLAELYSMQGHTVIAGARHLSETNRKDLAKGGEIIHVVQDVMHPYESTIAFLNALQNKKIDLLIHNAGIYPKKGNDNLYNVRAHIITETVFINAASPVEITRHLLENNAFNTNAKVVGISSLYGSISDTNVPRDYSYAISKTAMNMAFKIMALELLHTRIQCFTISPGWVNTDMGGPHAPLKLPEVCPAIINVIASWTPKDGQFVDYKGNMLNW